MGELMALLAGSYRAVAMDGTTKMVSAGYGVAQPPGEIQRMPSGSVGQTTHMTIMIAQQATL